MIDLLINEGQPYLELTRQTITSLQYSLSEASKNVSF
jgi:hypothetical protein